MTRTFAVTPPPSHAAWLLGGLLLVPLVVIAFAWVEGTSSPTLARVEAPLAFGLLTIILVAAITFWGLARRRVLLENGTLVVKAALFQRKVTVSELDLARARLVDLEERTELRPALKTFGMALPGFHAGWFLLRDRSRGFCLLTSRRRVLWLPTRSGKSLLLSLERPDALLDALRQPT